MAITQEGIRNWLTKAKCEGATHLIVASDTYDHQDYPVPVMPGTDVEAELKRIKIQPMTSVMEVYALHLNLETQLREYRSHHTEYPPDENVPVSPVVGPRVHDLKCDPEPFQAVYLGSKTFEVRINDRDYKLGDTLHMREYNQVTNEYTGRWVSKRVTYLLPGGSYGLPDNLCVMALL